MTLSRDRPDPGQQGYPKLKKYLTADIDGVVRGTVNDGRVVFTRFDEDTNDTVSISMSEWDFGNFVEAHLIARMEQAYPRKEE